MTSMLPDHLKPWFLWTLEDKFPVIQGKPPVTDPVTKKTVDSNSLYLTYLWSWLSDGWVLAEVEIHGNEITEDGDHPDDNELECLFYDPTAESEEDGGFPVWALEMANRRMSKLPPVPAIPENFDE